MQFGIGCSLGIQDVGIVKKGAIPATQVCHDQSLVTFEMLHCWSVSPDVLLVTYVCYIGVPDVRNHCVFVPDFPVVYFAVYTMNGS